MTKKLRSSKINDKLKTWEILEQPKTWTARVEQDPDNADDCLLIFPEGLVERVGWELGDTLSWELQDNGTVIIRKVD